MTLVFGQFEVDAVLLDLDGTLVDTLDDFVPALNRMLADLPLPLAAHRVDRESVARLLGKGSENLIRSVLSLAIEAQKATNKVALLSSCAAWPETDLNAAALESLFDQAWPSYQRHYQAANGQHATVYPGVEAALTYLKAQGLKLACLTNKPTAFAQTLLQAKGLAHFFQLIFGGDAFERKKPDPLPLLKACAALGTVPGRTLMIGDSSNDAGAARAAGCPVLLVSYGYNHGLPVRAVDADAFTDSLQSLIPG